MAKMNENSTVVESVERSGGNIQVTLKSIEKPPKPKLVKRVGTWLEGDAKTTTYLATRKEMMLFITENQYIQFKNHAFLTNKPDVKEYIEQHPIFGQDIFANEFPKAIREKMEDSRRYITKDPDEHEASSR